MDNVNELALCRETVLTASRLLDTSLEQSVELDYILPDYYPDFFRLLSCTAEPTITHYDLQGGTLLIALCVKLTVWYLAENSPQIQVMTQKLDYQKQIPWNSDAALDAVRLTISAEPSYVNCRAVNSRRIDIRGAVRISVLAEGTLPQQVLSNASGLHMQCQTAPFQFVSEILRVRKQCSISEDFVIPAAQPPMLSVLRETFTLHIAETRPIAGKIMVKGEIAVSMLYTASGGNVEPLLFSLPLNQILEPNGLTDEMPCTVTGRITDYLVTPESENSGDLRKLHLDMQIMLCCEAMHCKSAELVTDVYSTLHPVTLHKESLPMLTVPVPMQERISAKIVLSQPDAVITKVYAAWAEGKQWAICTDENGGQVLQGMLCCCVLAADAEGMPLLLTQKETISQPCSMQTSTPNVTVQSCSYTLSAADSVILQAELQVQGEQQNAAAWNLLTDVQADAENRLQEEESYALRLYFAQANESLWEIAKRYHTAVHAIMEENDCSDGVLNAPQMLLIPIVR